MAKINSYRDLIAWQKAMDLVVEIHKLSRRFPRDELYALVSQIRRSSYSVASNIAEGHGRGTPRAFINSPWIANGSLKESETQVLISERLAYVQQPQTSAALALSSEVGRLIAALIRSLERRIE
jgi:four helix bundle protein